MVNNGLDMEFSFGIADFCKVANRNGAVIRPVISSTRGLSREVGV